MAEVQQPIIAMSHDNTIYEKDEQISQLTLKLKQVTEKYNTYVYHSIDNQNLVKELNQTLSAEQAKVEKLAKENVEFQATVSGLVEIANEVSRGFQSLKEEAVLNKQEAVAKRYQEEIKDINTKHEGEMQVLNTKHQEQIENMKNKHQEEIETLKRSNKVLKELLQQQETLKLAQPQSKTTPLVTTIIPEENKLKVDSAPAKDVSTMKSARQNRYRNHRKSRSFGIGENINFNFPFKTLNRSASPVGPSFFKNNETPMAKLAVADDHSQQSFCKAIAIATKSSDSESDSDNSEFSLKLTASSKSDLSTGIYETEPCSTFKNGENINAKFFRELQNPLSPLKLKFAAGHKKESSNSSLKISMNHGNHDGHELESPITESKMNKLFGSSNISLVNMSRPIRNNASSGGRFKRSHKNNDHSKQPTVQKCNDAKFDMIVPKERPQEVKKDQVEQIEDFAVEICDAKKVDYISLDPKYVITPKVKQPEAFGSVGLSENASRNKTPVEIQSPKRGENHSPKRVDQSPKRQGEGQINFRTFDNKLAAPHNQYAPQSSPVNTPPVNKGTFYNIRNDSKENVGLQKILSHNNSFDTFPEPLHAVNTNNSASLHSTKSNSSGTNETGANMFKKGFMGFEKPDKGGFFGRRRERSNSNSSLRKFF